MQHVVLKRFAEHMHLINCMLGLRSMRCVVECRRNRNTQLKLDQFVDKTRDTSQLCCEGKPMPSKSKFALAASLLAKIEAHQQRACNCIETKPCCEHPFVQRQKHNVHSRVCPLQTRVTLAAVP